MEKAQRDKLTEYLGQFVTESKKERIQKVLAQRTRYVTVVMEDFENAHNGSAVLRTCESMGIQDVHFIENKHKNRVSPYVSRGGGKWLDIFRYNEAGEHNTKGCLQSLKEKGYAVWVTDPSQNSEDITKLDVERKIALAFGTEYRGVSVEAKSVADKNVFFPMYGFTESFNVSVSVALCLHVLTEKLRISGLPWQLPEEEKEQIVFDWYRKMVRRSDLHEQHFLDLQS